MPRGAYVGINDTAQSVKAGFIGAHFAGYSGHPECIVSSANTLLYSTNGRNYKKAYNGEAYGASVVSIDGWLAPMLVGRTPEVVATYTDGNHSSGVQTYETTVTFRGECWYVSSGGAAYQNVSISSANVIHLNSVTGVAAYASRAEAALDLLQYAAALPAQDHIAHLIKRAYIGIGGVARPCWSSGTPTYYGAVTSLSAARALLAAASAGEYALFAAGNGPSAQQTTVDVYNDHLVRSNAAPLAEAKNGLAGTRTGNYALFAGGSTRGFYTGCVATVDAYDTALTKILPEAMGQARRYLAAAAAGQFALLCGGSSASTFSTVDGYDEMLIRTECTPLSTARSSLAGASAGTYALLAGGGVFSTTANGLTTAEATVDAYDATLTRHTPAILSVARSGIAGAKLGGYALFAGGFDASLSILTTIEAYDEDLTATLPSQLSLARGDARIVVLEDFAIIHGGNGAVGTAVTEVYDDSLTRSVLPEVLGSAYLHQYSHAGAAVGSFALFGGGYTGNNVPIDSVQAYTLV